MKEPCSFFFFFFWWAGNALVWPLWRYGYFLAFIFVVANRLLVVPSASSGHLRREHESPGIYTRTRHRSFAGFFFFFWVTCWPSWICKRKVILQEFLIDFDLSLFVPVARDWLGYVCISIWLELLSLAFGLFFFFFFFFFEG